MLGLSKRFGTFKVTGKLIGDNPDEVAKILSDVIIIRAEYMFHSDTMEYIGWSKHFREVEAGTITPEYITECTRDGEGNVTVKWVEQI